MTQNEMKLYLVSVDALPEGAHEQWARMCAEAVVRDKVATSYDAFREAVEIILERHHGNRTDEELLSAALKHLKSAEAFLALLSEKLNHHQLKLVG
jgi:hypothetical protein